MKSLVAKKKSFISQKQGNTGVMICLVPPLDIAKQLTFPVATGESEPLPLEEMHMTLAFLGDSQSSGIDRQKLIDTAALFTVSHEPFSGAINGVARFGAPEEDVTAVVALVDSPLLPKFRQDLIDMLQGANIPVVLNHGFTPHITMAYVPKSETVTVSDPPTGTIAFDSVWVVWGDEWTNFPLTYQNGEIEMPYKLVQDKGGYFVEDDKGKRYSDHPMTRWKARAQLRVLNEAEAKKSKEVSLDQQLSAIRHAIYEKFMPPVMESPAVLQPVNLYIREVYGSYVLLEFDSKILKVNYALTPDGDVVVGEPVEVEISWVPTGKCIYKAALTKDGLPSSAFLVVEDSSKVTTWHLPVKDAQGKADHKLMGAAWAALHGGYRGNKYEGSGKTEAIAKLRKLYAAESMTVPGEKSFRVFKQADGSYRWVLLSSSAFRDRDGEIVTAKSLEEDVERCDKAANYGPLRWWHLGGFEAPDGLERWDTWKAGPGVDLGTCDFNMLHGKMLIESGTFKSAEIGEAFSEIQDLLEASIAFSHPPDEPGKSKQYQNIHRFERSLLPEGMASNLLTKLYVVKGESTMKAQEKLAALMAILKGKPDLAQQILKDAESVQKAAEEAGLEFKEVEELIVQPAEETPVVEEPVAEDVIGDMSRSDLEKFVSDQITKVTQVTQAEYQAKEAKTNQALADALESIKGLTARAETAEANVAKLQKELIELTDARPVGVKQLEQLRPTNSAGNLTEAKQAGPQIDPDFIKLYQGGKSNG